MVCYNPLQAFLLRDLKSGKNSVIFPSRTISSASDCYTQGIDSIGSESVEDIKLPCSVCVGCRLEYARQWSVRCVHEASYHLSNCFITLTYSNEFLPPNGSLVKADFQDFMKRLRYYFPDYPIKYFMCGEYGDKLSRPHYHAILFGLDFADKTFRTTRRGNKYFDSQILNDIWGKGKCVIGEVTLQSAAYVARYAVKKVTGNAAKRFYRDRIPEYAHPSNGIGKRWLLDNFQSVYESDEIIILNAKNKAVRHKPPRRYDEWMRELDPVLYARVKARRVEIAESRPEYTKSRLRVKEQCKLGCLSRLSREYEQITDFANPIVNPYIDEYDYFFGVKRPP